VGDLREVVDYCTGPTESLGPKVLVCKGNEALMFTT
jgi:hypothetical protein